MIMFICTYFDFTISLCSPTPLKFFDLNLKNEVKFYKARGPTDKCNIVGRTMTGDPYKTACKLVSSSLSF